ncbi:acyl-coenzyme A thioesterase PaaI-like protein [Nocardia bhagyanarayanae]|uniref:Acyl-coenzyme A thioesterase PaaI-like protein n=2 Tax=Nocardia bhagyanarayanae TaxID=1215925 RepID=A0A543EW18_9NOCA|nr:acyl-coenzyme A thioesterase PaaI-like protein [Nocardia bhagyanarayanae]
MVMANTLRTLSARQFRLMTNAYPVFLMGGVRIEHVADDWSSVTVRYKVSGWNKNHAGVAFGGILSMMTDPFFGLMALWQLGEGYRVWNTTATTEFVRPGRGLVRVTMLMPPEDMAEIRANLEADGVSRANHSAELVGADGELVARTSQELYVRRRSR